MFRNPLAIAVFMALPLAAHSLNDPLDDWGDSSWGGQDEIANMPIVLTATRLRQSQLDTPASVTIIEAELIERMGIRTIEEIFRLVPGMLVANDGTHGGKQTTVTYHGTQVAEHRRLQVLVDGRSVYKPALPSVPRVSWTDLPLAVEDIQRIEVIRGPNSAAYGANSFLGIVNILTKKPEDVHGVRAKVTRGSNGIRDFYVNKGAKIAGTDYRITLSGKSDDGFDFREDKNSDEPEKNRDSREINHFSLRTNTTLSKKLNLETQIGYKEGTNQQRETEDIIYYRTPQDIDVVDSFLWTRLHHEISQSQQIQYQAYYQYTNRVQEWEACIGSTLTGGAFDQLDYCVDANLNGTEERVDVEIQHTMAWNKYLRTVSGTRYRKESVESETYLPERFDVETRSLFGNAEIKLTEDWVINLGVSWEDDDLSDSATTPRIAINKHISNNQVLRLIYSEAVRSPNIFEQRGQEIYRLRNAEFSTAWEQANDGTILTEDEFIYVATSPTDPQLQHEKIRSHELSYFALLADGQFQFDIKVFRDDLDNLISEPLGNDDEQLTNSTSFTLEGAETQIKWSPVSSDELLLTYAYINPLNERSTDEDYILNELRLMTQHSGSAAWLHRWTPRTSTAVAYYFVDDWNKETSGGPYDFERLDANVTHTIPVTGNLDLRLSGTLEYRLDNDPLLWRDNQYNDKEKYFISAELVF